MNRNELLAIVQKALEYSQKKAEEANSKLPPESQRGLDCGFAWVVCKPGNCRLAKVLKEAGATAHWEGGVSLWNPSGLPTQSVGPKSVGAAAFVLYIKEHTSPDDYKVLYHDSRLD